MRTWLRNLLWILFGLFFTPPLLVLAMRWIPPPVTAFMLHSPTKPVDYRWVPATQHPDVLRKAVVAAEDQKFYGHSGFDFEAIDKALQHNQKNKRVRGASTITQQVAKNLFLWPGRSWLRKGVEVTFTVLIEACWDKPRILEVYLNIAEFGPGIFGAEAAAQTFFKKPAAKLNAWESARLAAVLPNPRKWKADAPGPYVQGRTQKILRLIGHGPPSPRYPEPLLSPEEIPDEWDELEAAPAEPESVSETELESLPRGSATRSFRHGQRPHREPTPADSAPEPEPAPEPEQIPAEPSEVPLF